MKVRFSDAFLASHRINQRQRMQIYILKTKEEYLQKYSFFSRNFSPGRTVPFDPKIPFVSVQMVSVPHNTPLLGFSVSSFITLC